MKTSEAIFTAHCQGGKIIPLNTEDWHKFAIENDQQDLVITMKQKARTGEKMRMYAYYHGPLLECALIGYTYAGWEGLDKVKVDYLLLAEFAKDFLKRPDGSYQPVIISKASMTKARFLKYLQDCIYFIEQELKQSIPDSDEFKMRKATGRKYKRVGQEDSEPPHQQFMPSDESLI